MNDIRRQHVQFGIRHLLLVMLVAAALSGALAPFLRDLTTGQWLRLTARGFVVIIGAGGVFTLFLRRRIAIERKLESVDWMVACRGESWSGAAPLVLLSIAAAVLLVVGILDAAIGSAKRIAWEERVNLEVISMGNSAFASLVAATALSYLRYPLNRMLIGQTGVVVWMHFFSWRQISWSRPRDHHNSLLLNVAGWKCSLQPAPEMLPKLADDIASKAAVFMQPVVT
jgi:hypothetical protein